jgi:RNA polymerase sigma-54 factor
MSQLRLTGISERDRQVVTLLIAHLDEEGYLKQDLDELHAAVSAEIPLDRDELSIALRNLQNLEPTGVGARDVCECLALQLRALPADTPYREEALKLVTQHLNVLAGRDYPRLKRLLGVNDEELKELRDLILSLDPKPGRAFGQGDTRYVVPDVLVRKVNSRWVATLNREAMPRLRINKMYADILQGSRDSNAKHLAGQLQEARWLIKNVQQRFDTILRVTQAIVDRQKHFFEHGEVAMRPLVLREIAEAVGLHESTISRVTTQKYMLTARGIFELKYFFGSHVSTDAGGACSSTAIRALIKQLVAAEDGKKPLSDHRISDLLAQQGIQVARRTVAKYREAMQIQPANLRKSI